MRRTSGLLLAALLIPAGAALGQGPDFQDPYKVYVPAAPRYWGYGGSPVADVLRAQGEFLIDMEHIKLLQQQLVREKLTTHKLQLEPWD